MRPPRYAAPVAIFLVAYLVRLLYLLQIAGSPFFDLLQLDPLYYYEWAQRLAAGDWIGTEVFEQSPLYPYLLALFLKVCGPDLWLLRLLQIGVGACTCVLTWALGCKVFDRATGLLAGLGCAFYGPFLFYEGQVMKEFLTPPLATAALLALWSAGVPRAARLLPWRVGLAGGLLGIACLVRDNFLLLIGLLALWILFERGWRSPAVPALLAGTLIAVLPVGLRNYAVSGDLVLTTSGGGEVFYIGNGPYANGAYVPPPWVRSTPKYEHEDFRVKAAALAGRPLTRAEASRFWWRQGLVWIADHPLKAAALWGRKIALFWNDHELPDNYSFYSFRQFAPILRFTLSFGPVAVAALVGIVLTWARRRALLPLYLAAAGYMLSVILFFNFARFRLPVVPILMIFAAQGVLGAAAAIRQARVLGATRVPGATRARGALRPLLAPALVLALAIPAVWIDWSSAAEEPFQDRLHLGAAWRQAGKPEEAVAVLRRVIVDAEALVRRHGGDPNRPESTPGGITFVLALSAAHRDLAGALDDLGRHEEAAQEMTQAAVLSPQDARLWLALCASLKGLDRMPEAMAACRRAVDTDPGSFGAHFELATLLDEAGQKEEALRELQRARGAPGSLGSLDLADYHYGMGAVLYSMPGREREAIPHFQEGLRLNPDARQAAEVRAALSALGASP